MRDDAVLGRALPLDRGLGPGELSGMVSEVVILISNAYLV